MRLRVGAPGRVLDHLVAAGAGCGDGVREEAPEPVEQLAPRVRSLQRRRRLRRLGPREHQEQLGDARVGCLVGRCQVRWLTLRHRPQRAVGVVRGQRRIAADRVEDPRGRVDRVEQRAQRRHRGRAVGLGLRRTEALQRGHVGAQLRAEPRDLLDEQVVAEPRRRHRRCQLRRVAAGEAVPRLRGGHAQAEQLALGRGDVDREVGLRVEPAEQPGGDVRRQVQRAHPLAAAGRALQRAGGRHGARSQVGRGAVLHAGLIPGADETPQRDGEALLEPRPGAERDVLGDGERDPGERERHRDRRVGGGRAAGGGRVAGGGARRPAHDMRGGAATRLPDVLGLVRQHPAARCVAGSKRTGREEHIVAERERMRAEQPGEAIRAPVGVDAHAIERRDGGVPRGVGGGVGLTLVGRIRGADRHPGFPEEPPERAAHRQVEAA